jgi:cell division protease FtsH
VKVADDVSWDGVAAMTAGMAGAELANVINEAALLAVRRNREAVGQAELREAVERVVAGLEKRSRVLRPEEKERVAHHEVGHALIGLALPALGQLEKISIIPRGVSALGYTMQIPTEDRFLMTRSELENRLAQLLGGRAAEEIIYGEESTGGSDDLQKATQLARRMVLEFGMSSSIGVVSLIEHPTTFVEGMVESPSAHGSEVARLIDREIRRIIEVQHERARALLQERIDLLRAAARQLLARETLSGDELVELENQYRDHLQPAYQH